MLGSATEASGLLAHERSANAEALYLNKVLDPAVDVDHGTSISWYLMVHDQNEKGIEQQTILAGSRMFQPCSNHVVICVSVRSRKVKRVHASVCCLTIGSPPCWIDLTCP